MADNEIKLNICYGCMRKLEEGQMICSFCGRDSSLRQNPENTLPEGTVLSRKYLVGRVLGRGGFGVTYLGYDLDLQLSVAIKEYFPREVCHRSMQSYDVRLESEEEAGTVFSKGREVFLEEARTLAKINSPYIVHVRDFFREHGTAYIVMDYLEGVTLGADMKKNGGRLPYQRVLSLMEPLIQQLDLLHKKSIIHRDIKPDNIMVLDDENGEHPVLLDFGAAREYVSNETKTMTGVVTPGYSPLEQYSHKSRQGAYTDVYALCATMYHAISGVLPPSSIERNVDDTPLKTFENCGVIVPGPVEQAIMHGLALKSTERTQTMGQLLEELKGEDPADFDDDKRNEQTAEPVSEAKTDEVTQRSQPEKQREISSTKAEAVSRGKSEKKPSAAPKIITAFLAGLLLFAGIYFGFLRNMNESGTKPETTKETAVVSPTSTPAPTPTPTSTAREADLSAFKTVGNIVTFGTYEQDNNASNGKEEIEWIVLANEGNQSLLISRYALDCRQYNTEYKDVTWETCSLRPWLNGTFLNTAFTADEQKAILAIEVNNGKSQGYSNLSTNGGNNTTDQIFLLSYAEAGKFFDSDNDRICKPTAYAKAQGVYINYSDNYCGWWLRSPGSNQRYAAYVSTGGSLGNDSLVGGGGIAVRPALWIDLDNITSSASMPTPTPTPTPTSTPTAREADLSAFKTVGNIVTFGTYEQDNDTSNGKEDIEWIVLANEGNQSLLISRYALDCRQYNTKYKDVTWETCSLRPWLNGTFLNTAFTADEQKAILAIEVNNGKSQGNSNLSTNGGNNTTDQIFLLSYAEAGKFFDSDNDRICKPTAYAKAKGADTDDSGNCWWWLRSPGSYQYGAEYVFTDGSLGYSYYVYIDYVTVRPAFWINLEA